MTHGGTWLEQLEARLEEGLETFLRSNPEQESLLADQEARDQKQKLRAERLRLQQDAEQQRQTLLHLVREIRSWQVRVTRARDAGAHDLAGRAEAHVADLMEQGRQRWRNLADLGRRFAVVEGELEQLNAPRPSSSPPTEPSLDEEWGAFEAQQELQDLRRHLQL